MSVTMTEVARGARVGGAALSRVIGSGAGLDRAGAVRVPTGVGEPARAPGGAGQGRGANVLVGMLAPSWRRSGAVGTPQGVAGRSRPPFSGPPHSGLVPGPLAGRVERPPTARMVTGEPGEWSGRLAVEQHGSSSGAFEAAVAAVGTEGIGASDAPRAAGRAGPVRVPAGFDDIAPGRHIQPP